MENIKPIETVYNGYRFRSRLEARWAVFFDSLGIKYVYEPEGLCIDGKHYLPDFFLPESKQFFEVKGVMSDDSKDKIESLISAGYSVTIGYDDGKFTACDYWCEDTYELCTGSESWLCKCKECGKYWFMGSNGIYSCQCCSAYDGDHLFDIVMSCCNYDSPHSGHVEYENLELWNVAKGTRFEHGETPTPKRFIL